MAENNIDWGSIFTPLVNGGLSLYDAIGHGGTTDMGVAKDAAALADPFASQRPFYQQKLMDLYNNPSSLRDTPGYQFGMNQGLDAIRGAGNAIYGGTRAGAIYPELAKFATGYADNSFHNRVGELMQAAGVNAGSPGTAGLLYEKGGENQNASLGSGVTDLFNGLFGQGGAGLINGGAGLIGLIAKYLNPSSSSGPGAPSGVPFGMGDRGTGSATDWNLGGGFGMNDRGIGSSGGAFDFGMGDRGVGQDVYLGGSPTFDEGALSGNGFDLGGSDWQDILGDFDWGNL